MDPVTIDNKQILSNKNDMLPIKPELSSKQIKKNLTSFWGIELNNDIIQNTIIQEILQDNPHLIPLNKIHSTILYVGKKINDNEQKYIPYENKKCKIYISHVGFSDDAIALKIDKIILTETLEKMPSDAVIQHVTIALKKGIPAKDSIKTLEHNEVNNNYIKFNELIELEGNVKRYLF